MMAAILNSAMLDSDTAILDSGTLLSSLRFTQKHTHSTLTLIQTNSIWLKLIHSEWMWWWQPSWNLDSICHLWFSPWFSTKETSLILITKKSLNSLILTQLDDGSRILPSWIQILDSATVIHSDFDDGSHLQLCHLGFRHLVIFSQIHSKALSFHSDSDSN